MHMNMHKHMHIRYNVRLTNRYEPVAQHTTIPSLFLFSIRPSGHVYHSIVYRIGLTFTMSLYNNTPDCIQNRCSLYVHYMTRHTRTKMRWKLYFFIPMHTFEIRLDLVTGRLWSCVCLLLFIAFDSFLLWLDRRRMRFVFIHNCLCINSQYNYKLHSNTRIYTYDMHYYCIARHSHTYTLLHSLETKISNLSLWYMCVLFVAANWEQKKV